MNERERMIELIGNCKWWGHIEEMADYLLANGVTVQRWIPVKERLPVDWCPVLVRVREIEKPLLGSYRENVWFHEMWNTTFINGAVTHWMPLPPTAEGGVIMEKMCKNCGTPITKEYCEGYPEVCKNWTPKKPKTNADRIRAMSDEELAEWMAECNAFGENAEASQWLPWLKQPAKEEK